MPEETISIELASTADYGVWEHDYNNIGAPVFFSDDANPTIKIFRDTALGPDSYRHTGTWFKFELPLGPEDEILEAYIEFYSHGSSSNPTGYSDYVMELRAHAIDDGDNPASNAAITGWTLTSESVDFEVDPYTPPVLGGVLRSTPDLTAILNEIIARPGWAEDNNIVLVGKTKSPFYTDSSPPLNAELSLQKRTRESVGGSGITLVIRYTPGPPAPVGYDQLVVHDLTIEQEIYGTTFRYDVESVLEIEQDIAYVIVHNQTVEHTLEIEQDVRYIQRHERTRQHLLILTQDISRGVVRYKTVEHTLAFFQDIQSNTFFVKQVIHELEFEQDIEATYVYNKSVENVLDIDQDIHSNMHNRTFEHVLVIDEGPEFVSILQQPKDVQHTLVFEQDIIAGGVWSRTVEHDLVLRHSFIGWIEMASASGGYGGGGDGSSLCQRLDTAYHPFGDGSVDFPEEPTLVYQNIVLDYPTTSPTHTITLPKPLLANREELVLTRIQRRTRGGNLKTFSAAEWVKVRTFRYKFEGLDTDKVEEFFTFLGQTLGLRMRLTDYEGRQWDGYIVSPDGESAQFFKQCGKTTQFDFDGVEV